MNPEYTTARADDPRLASASAPDATPVPLPGPPIRRWGPRAS